MKIAFIAAECYPLFKVGEIADVVASLPRALARLGHHVSVYLPFYGSIDQKFTKDARWIRTVELKDEGMPKRAEIRRVISRDININLVDCPELYQTAVDPYDEGKPDPRRHAFFSLAVLESLTKSQEPFDVIHLHDWPTGLLPVYRSLRYKDSIIGKSGILFSIHNLANQGTFPADDLARLGLPSWLNDSEQLEFFNNISMLKAGILWSTMIGAVSPTYAREIQTEAYGCGFEGILKKRIDDLAGVLNGIDTEVWDPTVCEVDREEGIWPAFTDRDSAGKAEHRSTLCTRFHLQQKTRAPLFSYVGELTEQRGIGALLQVIPKIIESGGQVIIMGEGSEHYEKELVALAERYKDNMAVKIANLTMLAKRIFAASDFFLMPSKFEPCGLSHMIASRYGAIPIVAYTGGLADTIRDVDEHADGNGLTFATPPTMEEAEWLPHAVRELTKAIDRAFKLHADAERMATVRRRAMRRDFSWDRSARKYEDIYYEVTRRERGEGGHHGP